MKGYLVPICLLALTACSSTNNTLKVKDTDYKEWPLIVSEGTLSCEPGSRVTFTTSSGTKYGVNGAASGEYPNILEISKDIVLDEKNTIKMSPSELIKTGLTLCTK